MAIRERIETIQTTAQLKYLEGFRRPEETCCHSESIKNCGEKLTSLETVQKEHGKKTSGTRMEYDNWKILSEYILMYQSSFWVKFGKNEMESYLVDKNFCLHPRNPFIKKINIKQGKTLKKNISKNFEKSFFFFFF